MHRSQDTWLNWRHFVWRNGPKYQLPDSLVLSLAIGGDCRLLLQPKEVPRKIKMDFLECPSFCTCPFMSQYR